jgi:hypothetical protein
VCMCVYQCLSLGDAINISVVSVVV